MLTTNSEWSESLPWWIDTSSVWNTSSLRKAKILFFDFETTNLDKGSALNRDNDVVLACWIVRHRDGTITKHHKFGNEYEQQELYDAVMDADFVVAHNAKFDLQWLARCGVDLRKIYASCTMLAQWVLDGNLKRPKSLNALAARYQLGAKVDIVGSLIKLGVCPSDIPRSWLLNYGMHDVQLCFDLFHKQLELLNEYPRLFAPLHVRNLTMLCLADIETNGMHLDEEAVQKEWETSLQELEHSETQLRAIVGTEVNFRSPKQKAELLYDKLGFKPPMKRENGKLVPNLSTRADVLSKLVAKTDIQDMFLRMYKKYNKYSALVTKNLTFFRGVCKQYGGKFYAVFNQGVTSTGRLSSSGRPLLFEGETKPKAVQMQNIPRSYKRLFWSGDENLLIGEADGAQLEFRVAAALGNDAVAIDEIDRGVDVHSVTAKVLTDAGEPTDRQAAKSRTFSPLYGGKGSTDAERAYCEFFREKYKGISETQRSWALEVLQSKKLDTPYGLRFYWPEASLNHKTGYISHTTEIYNFPVQGLATGEIIPISLVHFWYLTEGTGIRIINTIHDSVISTVPIDQTEEYERLSKICFTEAVFGYLLRNYGFDFKCSLGCGIKVSRNWGAAPVEIIYSVAPDGASTRKEKT